MKTIIQFQYFLKEAEVKLQKMKPFKVGGVQTLLDNIPNALIVPIAIKEVGK